MDIHTGSPLALALEWRYWARHCTGSRAAPAGNAGLRCQGLSMATIGMKVPCRAVRGLTFVPPRPAAAGRIAIAAWRAFSCALPGTLRIAVSPRPTASPCAGEPSAAAPSAVLGTEQQVPASASDAVQAVHRSGRCRHRRRCLGHVILKLGHGLPDRAPGIKRHQMPRQKSRALSSSSAG